MFPWSESASERLEGADNALESAGRPQSCESNDGNVLYAFVKVACVFHAKGSSVELW